MSAPHTNIERQRQRHRGPLIGISVALAVVAVLFLVFLGDAFATDSELLEGGTVAPQSVAPAPVAPDPVTTVPATPDPAAPPTN